MKKTITLKISILRAFLFLITLTVLSITTNFYISSKNISFELAETITRETAYKITERIAHYLRSPALQAQVISSFLRKKPPKNIMQIHEQLWEQLWEQLLIFDQLESLSVSDTFGNYIQVRRDSQEDSLGSEYDFGLVTRYINRMVQPTEEQWFYRDNNYQILKTKSAGAEFDPRIRKWFKNTKPEKRIYWTDTYIFNTTKKLGISISYPVSYFENDHIDGVVNLNIPLNHLSHFLSEQKLTKNSLVFIANNKGNLIAYPNQERLIKRDQYGELLKNQEGEFQISKIHDLGIKWVDDVYNTYLKNKQNFSFMTTTDHKNYLARVIDLPEAILPDWTIFIIIPEDDIMEEVYLSLNKTIIIALIIFCISLISVVLFANRVTRPLVALANQTQKIKNFELENVKHINSIIYEIKLMSDATFSMVQGLQSFRRYVPAALVRELINVGKAATLGASDETELTILFSDIQGFTTISENMQAQELMLHLSDYFEHLSNIIMEEHGTIDKYIGDAIMAFWGAPQKLPNAAYFACKSALRCQIKLKILNNQWVENNKPPMVTRIGIHTGMTVVGNLGSQYRMNYTVIGDSVNLASRLEGTNKLYGTQIIISEATYQQVAEYFLCRPLDIVTVKGKKIGVKIYELVADRSEFITKEQLRFCYDFECGFGSYLKQDWKAAVAIFETLEKQYPNDLSIKLFLERCQTFQTYPIPADWNGVFALHEK
jgi:adenylate cyclase